MILIFGKRGKGKTLLLVDFAVKKMLNGLADCMKSYEIIDEYNAMGYKFTKNFEHLLFSNIPINCSGTKIPDRRCYVVNPFKLSLYRGDYETSVLPPYSLVCISEAQRVYDSHKAMNFPSESSAYIETSRQADIDFILDCQRPKLILPNVRELVDRFIMCRGVVDCYDIKGRIKCHQWDLVEWEDWACVETYLNSGKLVNCKQYRYRNDMCLYECYDTKFMRYLHLKGRKKQDFTVQQFPQINSIEDVEKYGDLFGLNVPKGFFKKEINQTIKEEEMEF